MSELNGSGRESTAVVDILSGPLTPEALEELFSLLENQNLMGTIYVFDGVTEKIFYFSIGGVRLIVRGEPRCRSTEAILMELGALSQERLAEARRIWEERRASGKAVRFSNILLEEGFVDREAWQKACQMRLEEELSDLLTWKGAEFRFSEGNPPEEFYKAEYDAISATFQLKEFLEKIRRHNQAFAQIAQAFPSERIVLEPTGKQVLPEDNREENQLSAFEAQFLRLVDGKRSLKEIYQLVGDRVDRKRLYEAAFSLLRKGFVQKVDPERQKALEREQIQREVREIEEQLKRDPENLQGRLKLAQLYEELGTKDKAAECYSKAAETLEKKSPQEALKYYERAAQLAPRHLPIQNKLFQVSLKVDPQKAIQKGQELAQHFMSLGLFHRAKEFFQKLVQMDPQNVELREQYAQNLLKLYEEDEAVAQLRQVALQAEQQQQVDKLQRVAELLKTLGRDAPDIQRKVYRLRGQWWKAVLTWSPKILLSVSLVVVLLFSGSAYFYEYFGRKFFLQRSALFLRHLEAHEFDKARQILGELEEQYPLSTYHTYMPRMWQLLKKYEQKIQQQKFQELLLQALRASEEGNVSRAYRLWKQILMVPSSDPALQALAKHQYRQLEKVQEQAEAQLRKYERLIQRFTRLSPQEWEELERLYRRLREKGFQPALPIRIDSFPSGAEAYVNGKFQGQTPFYTLWNGRDPLTVQLRKQGYQERRHTFRSPEKCCYTFSLLPQGEQLKLGTTLPYGRLSPSGKRIVLWGEQLVVVNLFPLEIELEKAFAFYGIWGAVFEGERLWVSTERGLLGGSPRGGEQAFRQYFSHPLGQLLGISEGKLVSFHPGRKKLTFWSVGEKKVVDSFSLKERLEFWELQRGVFVTSKGVYLYRSGSLEKVCSLEIGPVGSPTFIEGRIFLPTAQGLLQIISQGGAYRSRAVPLGGTVMQAVLVGESRFFSVGANQVAFWEISDPPEKLWGQRLESRSSAGEKVLRAHGEVVGLWMGENFRVWVLQKRLTSRQYDAKELAQVKSLHPPLLWNTKGYVVVVTPEGQLWKWKK